MKKIISYCDKIINSSKASFVTKAISFFYIVKIHPEFVKKYEKKIFIDISFFKKIIKNLLFFLFYLILFNFFSKKKKKLNARVLIISHLTKEKIEKKDLYFGNLEFFLKKKKILYAKLLINHTKKNYFNGNISKKIIVLQKYLPFLDEVKIFLLKLKQIIILLKIKEINKNNLFFKSIYSLFDNQTTFALRMFFKTIYYLRNTKIEFLIFTFEGYGWERLSIYAAKLVNPEIKCIAYQHTFVTNGHISIKRIINGNYNPDIIWTSDSKSHNILKKIYKKINTKVVNIGYLKEISKLTEHKKISYKKTCLVLPEGIMSECLKILKFCLICAENDKTISYIIRLHPVIDQNKLLVELNINEKDLPKNIYFSSDSNLIEILSKVSFVLYRGSSSVLHAINRKICLIYLDIHKYNIDPLSLYNIKKFSVKKPNELIKIISSFKKKDFKFINSVSNINIKNIFKTFER